MKNTFKCQSCGWKFEAESTRMEFIDPVFGACAKIIAECPKCRSEATEYRKPKPIKVVKNKMSACGSGNCCCSMDKM